LPRDAAKSARRNASRMNTIWSNGRVFMCSCGVHVCVCELTSEGEGHRSNDECTATSDHSQLRRVLVLEIHTHTCNEAYQDTAHMMESTSTPFISPSRADRWANPWFLCDLWLHLHGK
jgi:hypothetical protein